MAAAGIIYKAATTVVNMANGDSFEQAVARTTPDQEVQAALTAGGGFMALEAAPTVINQAVDTVKMAVNSTKSFINGLFADPPVPVIAPGIGGDLANFTDGPQSNVLDSVTTKPVHGNSLNSLKKTSLYELLDSNGDHLKFGITSETIPESRYSQQFMQDKRMFIIDEGTRREMYEREHEFIIANRRGLLQLNDH